MNSNATDPMGVHYRGKNDPRRSLHSALSKCESAGLRSSSNFVHV